VAEREHVTRAAQILNLAQSAVSAAITSLEGQYQAKLFDRIGRGIVLTDAGRQFLSEARAVLASAAAAEQVLADLGQLRRGRLSVQASQTIASYWLPRHLVAFRSYWPGVEIRLSIGNTAQVARAVGEGVVELGFIEGVVDDPALVGRTVARDRLILVVHPDHRWAGRRVAINEIAQSDWVLRETGSGTRSEFEAALLRLGIDPATLPVVLELPSNESVRAAVEAGAGATVISASVAAPSIEAGLLVQVALDLPERLYQVIHHRDRSPSHCAGALLQMIGAWPAALGAGSDRRGPITPSREREKSHDI
jgi:DNA-binding transcriptional LysR family regulator